MSLAVNVRGLDGLTLISPIDAAFDDIARPMLGRIADLGLQLKPFLVILANDTTQTLVAFSITWRVAHKSGRSTTSRNLASFPHVVTGDALISPHPPGVAPGARRLEANGVVIHGWGDLDEYFDQFLPQFVKEKDQTLANAVTLQIDLDAAVFDDGTLIGPDEESWVADNFGEYVRAKQEWYRGIIDALDAGQTVGEAFSPIEQFSNEISRQLQSGRPPNQDNPLAMWKQQAAADVRRWQRKYSEDEIPQLLKQHIRLEPFVIRPRDTN